MSTTSSSYYCRERIKQKEMKKIFKLIEQLEAKVGTVIKIELYTDWTGDVCKGHVSNRVVLIEFDSEHDLITKLKKAIG